MQNAARAAHQFFVFLTACYHTFIDRGFFATSDGCIELAPLDAKEGDAICVFLGCRYPIVAQSVDHTDSTSSWIIRPAIVPGIINGEVLHGPDSSTRCAPL
jgi:hypothetical protein